MIRFILNREDVATHLPAGAVTLDFVRRHRGLTGTKEGCREGDCGACMVLLGEPRDDGVFYRPVNSCLLPLANLAGRHLVTIEGLNLDGLNPIQRAFVEEGGTQCGFCTPGFIVSFLGFLLSAPRWDVAAGYDAMAGNLCRCTGHIAIRRAADRVCAGLGNMPPATLDERVRWLVGQRWLPEYFLEVPERLRRAEIQAASASGGVPIAGGTDLFVQRADELSEATLTLLSRRGDLRGARLEGGRCVVGAATRWADLEDSPVLRDVLPGVEEYLKLAASRPIRHRATLGGNIVNASPIGDLTILLLALDAELSLSDGHARRVVRLRDFFLGYKKLNKRPEELVTYISFAAPPKNAVLTFEKVSRRVHLDIASVNSAMLATRENGRVTSIHLSAGGVAPVPLYLTRTSEELTGTKLTVANLRAALDTAASEITPISDVRGSADYKRALLRQLLVAHFLKLAPELEKELTA
jgi:xanthine dehydrogenase small subunit